MENEKVKTEEQPLATTPAAELINTKIQDVHGIVVSGGQNEIRITIHDGKVTADVKKRETARPQKEDKPFESLITQLARKDAVMAMFHRVMPGKRGKAAALVMVCARQLGHIADLPSFSMAVRAFGDIGCRSNFEKFLRFDFRDEEKEPILKALTL